MHSAITLGTVLVLIGTILCAVSLFWGYRDRTRRGLWGSPSPLTTLGAFLIGLGILLGAPALVKVG